MPSFGQIVIVGVGLLGGSIALATKRRGLADKVIGVGRTQEKLDKAIDQGLIDSGTTHLVEGVQQADLVVVCTPVETIAETVAEILLHCRSQCLVTDVGSTKAGVVAAVEQSAGQFIGSHPLAGDHRTGAAFARADLLEGKVVVVTPTAQTPAEATTRVGQYWQELGARVVELLPEEHDAALAITSHLPHLVASGLAATTPIEILGLAATGWSDTTRIAAADPALWQQIFLANREHVLAALGHFEERLAAFRSALATGDAAKLEQLLAEGKQTRDALGN